MSEILSQANRWPPCKCQHNTGDVNDALELRTTWRLHRGELTAANDHEVIISGAASSSHPTATDHRTEPERRVRRTDAASSTTIEPSNQSHHATSQEMQDLYATIANLQADLMTMKTETGDLRAEVRRLEDWSKYLYTSINNMQADMDYRMEWEDFQW
jgi:septal ring factor EnvC (AmiA/AmiB activator)